MDEAVASMESTLVSEETPLGPEEIAPTGDQTDTTEAPTPEIDAEVTTQQIIEAILFAADTPLAIPKIVSLLGIGSARDVKSHIEALNARYENEAAAFRIEKI